MTCDTSFCDWWQQCLKASAWFQDDSSDAESSESGSEDGDEEASSSSSPAVKCDLYVTGGSPRPRVLPMSMLLRPSVMV